MNLNGTIRRLRRAKGLTQEQVAQALGVSGPAVNKWERGACCPDLALLAPLARLLDTDLNTLLSFREELTGAEIAAFTEELYTLAQSGGIDAAFLRAEELLHRWPGCDRLTISLAMTLNGLFFTLGVAEPEPYERRLEPLYRALADSEEPDIRDQALHLLIGRHMRREEYAAAEELLSALPGAYRGEGDGHVLRFSHAGGKGAVTVPRPEAQLEVGTLQPFLDAYVKEHGGSIDYIHGADVARDLAARPGNIAFLLPAMGKEQLFPTVIRDGVLPRKTFSMGEAHDKRFYLEARKIR